jgi:hypothetical protein
MIPVLSEVHATVDGRPCIVQPDINQVNTITRISQSLLCLCFCESLLYAHTMLFCELCSFQKFVDTIAACDSAPSGCHVRHAMHKVLWADLRC